MKEKECTAPYHSENCPCQRCLRTSCDNCNSTSTDHFQPRAIMKVWQNGEIRKNKENLQFLSVPCHKSKDVSTAARKQLLQKTLKHGSTLEEYRELRNKNDLVLKE
jgi:hypothetical protein